LTDRHNKALQDHSAWALGNMAVESEEIRSMLRKNGVLQPLVYLLDSSVWFEFYYELHARIADLPYRIPT
jgi:hypothetical protein